MTAVAAYLRMGRLRRRLVREAFRELFALRWLGRDPGYPDSMRRLGEPCPVGQERGPDPPAEALREARRVGQAVQAVARRLPWHTDCVGLALAAHAMLARRGIPSVTYVGARRGGEAAGEPGLDLHAWLTVGPVVVVGAPIRGYRAVAAYAQGPPAQAPIGNTPRTAIR